MTPLDWTGRTVACLATGAGLSVEAVELVRRSGSPAIAINDAYRLAPWADVLLAFDRKWWLYHYNRGAGSHLRKLSAEAVEGRPDIFRLVNAGAEGFDPEWPNVRTGGNSGYGALHLAMQWGAARILLVGYNMGGTHFFGDHPEGLRRDSPYDKFVERFRTILPAAEARAVEIINCTAGSALPWFRFAPLENAL